MNIIEQLGGYEKACNACDKEIKEGGYPYELIKALLEYRREHNIFEFGDKVVFVKGSKSLMEVRLHHKTKKPTVRKIIKSNNYARYISPLCDIRHATDEEIKAGHRL